MIDLVLDHSNQCPDLQGSAQICLENIFKANFSNLEDPATQRKFNNKTTGLKFRVVPPPQKQACVHNKYMIFHPEKVDRVEDFSNVFQLKVTVLASFCEFL